MSGQIHRFFQQSRGSTEVATASRSGAPAEKNRHQAPDSEPVGGSIYPRKNGDEWGFIQPNMVMYGDIISAKLGNLVTWWGFVQQKRYGNGGRNQQQ